MVLHPLDDWINGCVNANEAGIYSYLVYYEGDNLIVPLKKQLMRDIFAGDKGPSVEILTATLGNDAGILGTAALWI